MPSYVLVPCKPLREGKSRLSAVLDSAERAAFCERMLRNTLRTATAAVPRTRVRVVTSDPLVRQLAADAYGVMSLPDAGLGLNAALRGGIDTLMAQEDGVRACTILPIDLPYATPGHIATLLETSAQVAVVPDARRSGTNALVLSAAAFARFEPAFGASSFDAHCGAARNAGLTLAVLDIPALAFDLDTPDDYERWRTGMRQDGA